MTTLHLFLKECHGYNLSSHTSPLVAFQTLDCVTMQNGCLLGSRYGNDDHKDCIFAGLLQKSFGFVCHCEFKPLFVIVIITFYLQLKGPQSCAVCLRWIYFVYGYPAMIRFGLHQIMQTIA